MDKVIERRKPGSPKSSPLPVDFVKMVSEVLSSNFEPGLKAIAKLSGKTPRFVVRGAIYPDEVMLITSLAFDGALASISAYASCDFDPKASAPTAQDLLGVCVDAVGSIFANLFEPSDPKLLEEVAELSISSFTDLPLDWTRFEIEKRAVYLRVDRANLLLEEMTDAWLRKHDPDYKKREQAERAETEELFVVGPKDRKPGGSSGLH